METSLENNASLLNAVLKVGGDPADLPFWQGCETGQFLVHRCNICQRHYWPASRCIEHGDTAMEWVQASGKAELNTYTVMHRSLLPAINSNDSRLKVPYVVAVVQLEEGPMYHTNIIGCEHQDLVIGMPLTVTMLRHESGLTLPVFSPNPAFSPAD